MKSQRFAQVDIWSAKNRKSSHGIRSFHSNEIGGASVEFVLLAIPLFLPILFFLNHFSSLSYSELTTRALVRESLRAYVTSDNPFVASARAEQVLRSGAKAMGLTQTEINSLDLKFECSKTPCLSPESRIRATLTVRMVNLKRIVTAEAEELISPWQWNGLGVSGLPSVHSDL